MDRTVQNLDMSRIAYYVKTRQRLLPIADSQEVESISGWY